MGETKVIEGEPEDDGKKRPEIRALGGIVREIVFQFLTEHGFDGLYYPGECACVVGDLMPCSSEQGSCRPGYRTECNPETCPLDGTCNCHIGPKVDDNNECGGYVAK